MQRHRSIPIPNLDAQQNDLTEIKKILSESTNNAFDDRLNDLTASLDTIRQALTSFNRVAAPEDKNNIPDKYLNLLTNFENEIKILRNDINNTLKTVEKKIEPLECPKNPSTHHNNNKNNNNSFPHQKVKKPNLFKPNHKVTLCSVQTHFNNVTSKVSSNPNPQVRKIYVNILCDKIAMLNDDSQKKMRQFLLGKTKEAEERLKKLGNHTHTLTSIQTYAIECVSAFLIINTIEKLSQAVSLSESNARNIRLLTITFLFCLFYWINTKKPTHDEKEISSLKNQITLINDIPEEIIRRIEEDKPHKKMMEHH